jgi:isoleucyl-tRNA synthetase
VYVCVDLNVCVCGRATKQWFANVEGIKEKALEVLRDKVQFVPPQMRTRLEAMIERRDEWCISRQRVWGVPIPVFYNRETQEPLLNDEVMQHLSNLFARLGTDCWWQLTERELLPPKYNSQLFVKGKDTLDVWFDSGVSWAAVLAARQLPLPADVYLEGSDQHRGWFQSSLLTSGLCVVVFFFFLQTTKDALVLTLNQSLLLQS